MCVCGPRGWKGLAFQRVGRQTFGAGSCVVFHCGHLGEAKTDFPDQNGLC